jgi:hypothetical protein
MPLSGRAYQNASGAPVASAEMIFTGIPLAKAAMAPSVPLVMAMSIDPATTGVKVEAPPSV